MPWSAAVIGFDHAVPSGTEVGGYASPAILRVAICEQVGSTVKRLYRNGAIDNIGAERASKWKLARMAGL